MVNFEPCRTGSVRFLVVFSKKKNSFFLVESISVQDDIAYSV